LRVEAEVGFRWRGTFGLELDDARKNGRNAPR
jgi:hypothetical protein